MNQHNFIVIISVLSAVAAIMTIFSMASEHWIDATAVLTERLQSNVSYGLFKGSIERQQLATTLKFRLTLVCDFGANACMYSCQQDTGRRKIELLHVIHSEDLDPCELERSHQRNIQPPQQQYSYVSGDIFRTKSTTKAPYMSSYIHLCSVMFLSLGMIFSMLSLTISVVNLKWHPVERIFNIFGLYIWNSIAAGCLFWSVALWGAMFGNHLCHNIAITDTLRQQLNFSSEGYASLGYSYYLVIVVILIHIINLVLLFARRCYLEKQPNQPSNNVNIEDVEIKLEFY